MGAETGKRLRDLDIVVWTIQTYSVEAGGVRFKQTS